ncbi:hypothetical protein QOZ80_6BG0482940 [Eleusine coracana subsp. coracana]|nr:hypothetical protein QOZ80_6BG0482940 [Eleusine coracana subsp. coracana]
MSPPRLAAVFLVLLALLAASGGVDILSKSSIESCARDSDPSAPLSCDRKLVLNMAVPSGSSGREASIVAKITEAEENDTNAMQNIRDPPVITFNKTAVYAAYALTYLRDVAYRPEELVVETRKCEPDAGADVVQSCERLRNEGGSIIEYSEPVCCPCGDNRVKTSCGNFIDKIVKGKHNTAHCVRFLGEWFHVFKIGTRSLGFNITVQVKKGSSVSEVVVSPENRTVVSLGNFLRVNLVGDLGGYTNIPSFDGLYLVTPRKGAGSDQPQDIGDEYSRWMLLDKFYFTYNGLECNKIGVGYEAFQKQPDFCSSTLWSCLNNQLWTFMEGDKNRLNKSMQPEYLVEGRFQRINQHPHAGVYSFSVGVEEVRKTNLLVEINADDIEYVCQRSPGRIISIKVPTFEALSQVGIANVTTMNTGKLEASYSLTFTCLSGINSVEEQFFIMKPDETTTQLFYMHTSTDQAANYRCTAILKASNFSEVDRGECQFSTTSTILNNGTQVGPPIEHKKGGIMGFFEGIQAFWRWIWDSVTKFFSGRLCSRTKCSSFLDLSCHFQYICVGRMLMLFGLFLATVLVAALLWFLHHKGFFDHLYDWWADLFGLEPDDDAGHRRHRRGHHQHPHHRHGECPRRHHAHKGGPSHYQHHRVLHRHGEQHADAAAGGHRHRHELELGVRHEDRHKHWHGKAVAALNLDGPSQQAPS